MMAALLHAWKKSAAKFGFTVLLLATVLWWADPENLIPRLRSFPLSATVSILGLLVANLFLVSFRFWRVLTHFGIQLPWSVASRSCLAGHVAGLAVISLFGQVAGRQGVLRDHGVPVMVNSSVAVY